MIGTSEELFESFAEHCALESLLSKRRGDADSQVAMTTAVTSSVLNDYSYADLLRCVIISLDAHKMQSAEKLCDLVLVLDRCKRRKALDPTAISLIVQHFKDMIRIFYSSKMKISARLEDDLFTTMAADAGADASAVTAGAKRANTGDQRARKKSRVILSDDSDNDNHEEHAEKADKCREASISLEVLEPLLEEALDYLRGIDNDESCDMEVRNTVDVRFILFSGFSENCL